MSLYFGFHYKGIVKEKYRKDIAAAFDKGCWSAVIDDELKRILLILMKRAVCLCFSGNGTIIT